ncbi:uncharacterized protein LOC142341209 isoform X2 [Convolutriloba macropyga]
MVSVFFGYCARHSILDMTPVLSTRLYVEMDLTPELESVFAIVTFVGITLSFLLSGLIAGRIGRKTCAILGTGWMVLWNILCGCAWNIEVLILLRFLMSLGACAVDTLDIHLCEVLPSKYTWVGILMAVYCGEATGKVVPFLTGLAMFETSSPEGMWRYYVLVLSTPSILFVMLASLSMDESPVYSLSKGKTENAIKVVNKIVSTADQQFVHEFNNEESPSETAEPTTFWQSIIMIIHDWFILRSLICVVLIGCSVIYTTYDLTYIATELVFLSGQTDSNYCEGTNRRTYLLSTSDYILLSGYMTFAFLVKVVSMYLANKFTMNLKKSSLICLPISIALASGLFLCPKIWVSLVLYACIDAISAIVELYFIIFIADIVPTNVRSAIYGFLTFLMYIPLAVTPYLIQVLAKKSEHYVTTTSISFITVSLLAALALPRRTSMNQ